MKCIHCSGKMEKDSAPVHIDREGCHVMLEEVPAWVCRQCGEVYFDETEVDRVQDLINSVEEKAAALKLSA